MPFCFWREVFEHLFFSTTFPRALDPSILVPLAPAYPFLYTSPFFILVVFLLSRGNEENGGDFFPPNLGKNEKNFVLQPLNPSPLALLNNNKNNNKTPLISGGTQEQLMYSTPTHTLSWFSSLFIESSKNCSGRTAVCVFFFFFSFFFNHLFVFLQKTIPIFFR